MTAVDLWADAIITPVHTVSADMRQVREALRDVMTAEQAANWERKEYTNHLGTAPKHAFQDGFWAGVKAVLNTQHAIDNLTQGELLAEIRKAEGSVYWPLLSGDPTIAAECPRCDRTVVIDREGLCPECAYEFQEID